MDNNNTNGGCCSVNKTDCSTTTSGCDKGGCWSKIIKGMIYGGIIFYAVNAISWTMLPFHMESLNSFTDTKKISKALIDTTTVDGNYMLPMPKIEKTASAADKVEAKAEKAVAKKDAEADTKAIVIEKPYAFVTIVKEGVDPTKMDKQVIQHIILSLLLGGILTCILKRLASGNCPVMTSAKIGLLSALIATAPCVIWFHFPARPALLNGIDIFVAITLAGLVIGKYVLQMPICCKKGSCSK